MIDVLPAKDVVSSMVILTNGLTDTVDEGFLKVANSLIKRLKKARDDIEVVSYERKNEITDTFINPNKFMSNKCVRDVCRRHDEVLYVPFPTQKWIMALRAYLLSRFSKKLSVVLVLKTPIGLIGKFLLKLSGARIVVFSRDAADFYAKIVGAYRVTYLKTGVDTQKFTPVSAKRAIELKKKYGFEPDRKVVLHVGHLNEGRNIRQLMRISDEYQVLLVTSTLTKNEEDHNLRQELLAKSNIKIIDHYLPNIQEIYQLADVYFFPVVESGHCIDVPLSCLEAAACDKPIVTTRFGEMKEFGGVCGFYYWDDLNTKIMNAKLEEAMIANIVETRKAVLPYDWKNVIDVILNCNKF